MIPGPDVHFCPRHLRDIRGPGWACDACVGWTPAKVRDFAAELAGILFLLAWALGVWLS